MNNILYPTDFSDLSVQSAHYAASLARKMNATLHLLHVNTLPMISTDMPAEALDTIIRTQEEEAEKHMKDLKKKLAGEEDVKLATHIRTGQLAEEVADLCEKSPISLVVMPTHGAQGWFEKAFIGTRTEKVIRMADAPVLVLPENLKELKVKRILYAADLESNDETALKTLRKLAETMGAQVSLIHAENDKQLDIFNDTKLMSRIRKALQDENVKIHTIKTDSVREGLEDFASENGYHILAATRINRGIIDNFFHSSITSSLVYSSKMPLLILHS